MSKNDPIWQGFPLQGPGEILEFLALEGVNRLLEPAYADARTELQDRLKSLVSPEAWKLYVELDDLVGALWLDIVSVSSKLVPALVRILKARNLMAPESFEELLEIGMAQAGVSPKKPGEIRALEGLDAAPVSSVIPEAELPLS